MQLNQSGPGCVWWDMSSLLRSTASHRLTRTLRAVVPLLLLVALVSHLGTSPFERSLDVLTTWPILTALLLGVLTTTAQALRWRTVAQGYAAADGLTRTRAVAECYRAALLNAVLPGGVLGDAVRVWRQRPQRERGLRSSAQAVIGERVVGTVLLALAVAAVLLPLEPMMSAIALAGAVGAIGVAAPTLKRLSLRGQVSVWGWSLVSLISLITKFGVAAVALGTVSDLTNVVTLALIALAGMSIPLGVGGFGPREAVTAVAFAAVGLSADAGVATAAAYGMLAAVSALPGVAVMLFDLRRDGRAKSTSVIEGSQTMENVLDADSILDLTELAELTDLAELTELAELTDLTELTDLAELTDLTELTDLAEVAELGEVVRLDLVAKGRRDRLASEALLAGRSQIEFETDVFAERELAQQSA